VAGEWRTRRIIASQRARQKCRWARHLLKEAARNLDRQIDGQIAVRRRQNLLDPVRQLLAFVRLVVAEVRQDHEPVILLGADDSAQAL
jgi:hypothetical protein